MNKNIIIPFIIIIVAVVIGGAILFFGNGAITNKQLTESSKNLRTLELSVPGMFCSGCTASVEGYVSSMPGVKRVQARLIPTKSATVVYDPDVITKEKIIKNKVFDLYGVSIISDKVFIGSVLPLKSYNGTNIPKIIKNKSQQVVLLLKQKISEGKNVSAAKSLFNQVNSNIDHGNFSNASTLLDTIISLLKNL